LAFYANQLTLHHFNTICVFFLLQNKQQGRVVTIWRTVNCIKSHFVQMQLVFFGSFLTHVDHFSRQLQRNQDFGNFDTGVVSKITVDCYQSNFATKRLVFSERSTATVLATATTALLLRAVS